MLHFKPLVSTRNSHYLNGFILKFPFQAPCRHLYIRYLVIYFFVVRPLGLEPFAGVSQSFPPSISQAFARPSLNDARFPRSATADTLGMRRTLRAAGDDYDNPERRHSCQIRKPDVYTYIQRSTDYYTSQTIFLKIYLKHIYNNIYIYIYIYISSIV